MPWAVVYGSVIYGGLSFVHLETEQFCLQLLYLVKESLSWNTLQNREYIHRPSFSQHWTPLRYATNQ